MDVQGTTTYHSITNSNNNSNTCSQQPEIGDKGSPGNHTGYHGNRILQHSHGEVAVHSNYNRVVSNDSSDGMDHTQDMSATSPDIQLPERYKSLLNKPAAKTSSIQQKSLYGRVLCGEEQLKEVTAQKQDIMESKSCTINSNALQYAIPSACTPTSDDVTGALQWLRHQLTEMKKQDRAMMCTLLDLRASINSLSPAPCHLHPTDSQPTPANLNTWGGSMWALSNSSPRLLSPLSQHRTKSMQTMLGGQLETINQQSACPSSQRHSQSMLSVHTDTPTVSQPTNSKRQSRFSLMQASSVDVLL